MVDESLDHILDSLKTETPLRLGKITKQSATLKFPKGPLTADEEAKAAWVETPLGSRVTLYQHRAITVLSDNFHYYRWKKYPDASLDVFAIEEFKPLFNEIHRAVEYLVEHGYSVHDALVEFLSPKATKAREEVSR